MAILPKCVPQRVVFCLTEEWFHTQTIFSCYMEVLIGLKGSVWVTDRLRAWSVKTDMFQSKLIGVLWPLSREYIQDACTCWKKAHGHVHQPKVWLFTVHGSGMCCGVKQYLGDADPNFLHTYTTYHTLQVTWNVWNRSECSHSWSYNPKSLFLDYWGSNSTNWIIVYIFYHFLFARYKQNPGSSLI